MFSPASCCISGCASLSSSLSGAAETRRKLSYFIGEPAGGPLGVSEVDLGKLVEVEALAD